MILPSAKTITRSAARLQHPHIVPIYEIGEQGRHPYMALEYVDGGSLDEQLDGTPWSGRQAAEWVATLARAIHYAHQRGVVHRESTPGNVLLRKTVTAEDAEERRGNAAASLPLRSSASSAVKYFIPKVSGSGL
jgi:serine/threonine protein kinase